ncbi:hypothetical protein FHP05_07090 [Cerasibacillus terrae]|uniref:Uncharacterized protein n=1 Tax=Cerasibacillus terrae TaxID=2498845 RepID=A0A5C8NXG8_9BACI|nr:hypothetical protein [Cerasibacillus terrae]TXL65875.1 hypothetical protein FHP05_07090 [Cerasibacillus terrae]
MRSKWTDPGIFLVGVLILIAAGVLAWWPKDIYFLGISLAGWLMFLSYFAWFLISVVYVIWIEKIEQKKNDLEDNSNKKGVN